MKKAKRLDKKEERRSRNRWVLPIVIVVVAAILIVFFAYRFFYMPPTRFQYKAAIVDQLSIEYLNQSFNETVTSLLYAAGFKQVDYYGCDEVTVEFYRNLPKHDYGIIILRVHSAERTDKPLIDLFTSEKYNDQIRGEYDAEFDTGQLTVAEFLGSGQRYVAIAPDFVRISMEGSFARTVIVMMGCNGVKNTSMADALRERGASVYLGWRGWIEITDTDVGTQQFLTYFLSGNRTINEATVETNVNYAATGTTLDYIPKNVGELRLIDIAEG